MKGRLKRYSVMFMSIVMMMMFVPMVSAKEQTTPLAFGKKTYSVKKGKTITLEISIPEGKKITKWKVSNKKIARINAKGRVKGLKKGTVRVTAITNTGEKAICKVIVTANKKKSSKNSATKKKSKGASGGGTVYWTPSGGVYHFSSSCPTLSRSKTVYSGTVSESGKSRACKVCG